MPYDIAARHHHHVIQTLARVPTRCTRRSHEARAVSGFGLGQQPGSSGTVLGVDARPGGGRVGEEQVPPYSRRDDRRVGGRTPATLCPNFLVVVLPLVALACGSPADEAMGPATGAMAKATITAASEPLCSLVGPQNEQPGVYGTDLGFTVPMEAGENSPLWVLFGDTWGEAGDACQYTPDTNDDLLGMLPAAPPSGMQPQPSGAAPGSCGMLTYELTDPGDATTWTRAHLYADEEARAAGQVLPLGFLRTPVGAFRDAWAVYGLFHRAEPAACSAQGDCPQGMLCSSQIDGMQLGSCVPLPGAPAGGAATICRDDADCGPTTCEVTTQGMCLTRSPFKIYTDAGETTPDWYESDARKGLAQALYVARKTPDESGDFVATQRFVTHRFLNLSLRTVAFFDAGNPVNNDYRPGHHTLLGFGRPSFVAQGGAQSLPFLFYVTLPQRADEPLDFTPHFFAGVDAAGRPRWTLVEEEAQPIYGQARLVSQDGATRIQFPQPEFDYVNQMSVSFVEPLQRWVMLYGGDLPTFMVADAYGQRIPQRVAQPVPGAIHMRTAVHPWGDPGSAAAGAADISGWTAPRAVLTRTDAAQYMVCADDPAVAAEMPGCLQTGDPHGPLDLVNTLMNYASELSPDAFAEVTNTCLEGQVVDAVQDELSGSSVGRLYGVNIIDSWTTPVAAQEKDSAGAELYWNVSTWNPYQVVLVRTTLYSRDLAVAQ